MEAGPTVTRRWFWATLALSCVSIVAAVFAVWEVVETRFFAHIDYVTLHYLYITRGITSSLLLAFWAAWFVLRQRRRGEEALRRSEEHYWRLLEASPGAVALFDDQLRVTEWNAAAERLYGFERTAVVGTALPTVPPGAVEELQELVRRVRAGEDVRGVETIRINQRGEEVEVEVSLMPFRDSFGPQLFLEVSEDIRERVRLRRSLVEIEKLASMGKMAAGTAHHLNTPLAAMLLRIEMMRERAPQGAGLADLEQLESSVRFCRQFVQRLLDFSRRPQARKRPEEIGGIIQAVVSVLAPAVATRRAAVSYQDGCGRGEQVLADRNLMEALFAILLSNALDAIEPGGSIRMECRPSGTEALEMRIADSGSGISPQDLPHVFEPFFTTKGPGKGTGLGLAIARNIVEEHGGSLRLESRAGHGTTASVTLPLWKGQNAQQGVEL